MRKKLKINTSHVRSHQKEGKNVKENNEVDFLAQTRRIKIIVPQGMLSEMSEKQQKEVIREVHISEDGKGLRKLKIVQKDPHWE